MIITYKIVKDILTNPREWDLKLEKLIQRAERLELMHYNVNQELENTELKIELIERIRSVSANIIDDNAFRILFLMNNPPYRKPQQIAMVFGMSKAAITYQIKKHCEKVLSELVEGVSQ